MFPSIDDVFNEMWLAVRLGGFDHRADYQIVGIVNTIRFRNPRGPGCPMFFVPLLQMWKSEWANNTKARSNLIGSILLRVARKPPDLAPRIQRALGAIDPNLTMLELAPMRERLGQLLSHEQLVGSLAGLFGGLALILALVGLYGLTTYTVALRTSEIGVRMALGATRLQVVRMILRSAVVHAAVGIAAGIPLALTGGQLLKSELYGVKAWDPVVLGAAAAIFGGCAAVAAVIPATRASSVDPVRALRVEN